MEYHLDAILSHLLVCNCTRIYTQKMILVMSESTPKPKLSLLFNKKRAQGEKKPEETENAQPPATTSFGRKMGVRALIK